MNKKFLHLKFSLITSLTFHFFVFWRLMVIIQVSLLQDLKQFFNISKKIMFFDRQQAQSRLAKDVLKIDKKQKYQYLLIVYAVVLTVFNTFSATMPDFIFMNPLFQCNGQLTTEQEACLILDQCKITNDFTAIVPAGLYCENEDTRSMIQSVYNFGAIIGMLTLVPFGDFGGKKLTILIALGMQIIGGLFTIIGIQQINLAIIIIGQLIQGISYSGFDIASYVMMVQYLPDKLCQTALLITCSSWGFGQMLFLPIYYFIPEWYNFMWLVLVLPFIGFFILSTFFLIEHPTFYLFKRKNLQKFKENLDKISLYNLSDQVDIKNMQIQAKNYLSMISKGSNKEIRKLSRKQQAKDYVVKLYCSRKNLVPLICLISIFSGIYIYDSGMDDSMERTGYNYGVSMFLSGLQQFICYLLFTLVCNKIGRKKGLVLSVILTSVVGFFFLIPFVKNSPGIQSIIISLSTASGVFAYSFFVLLEVESFPVQVMSSAQGTIQSFGQIILLFVPYWVIKMNDAGIHPIIGSSIFLLILGLVPTLFLKQTLGSFKSKTIEENPTEQKNVILGHQSLLSHQNSNEHQK